MIEVPCDRKTGKMNLLYLREMIEREIVKGNKPFFVNSTAGSTVMGSFDNHHEVADIC